MNFNISFAEAKRLTRKSDIVKALETLGILPSDVKRADYPNKPPRIQELKEALLTAITIIERENFLSFINDVVLPFCDNLSFESEDEYEEIIFDEEDPVILNESQEVNSEQNLTICNNSQPEEPKEQKELNSELRIINNNASITSNKPQQQNLDTKTENLEPKKLYYNDDCPICLCDTEENMRIFECQHRMHTECCEGLASNKCPICFQEINTFTQKEIKKIRMNKAKYKKDDIISETEQLRNEESVGVVVLHINTSRRNSGGRRRRINNIPPIIRNNGTFSFGRRASLNTDFF